MKKKEVTIQSIANAQNINIGYSDDDIVIIDNVNKLIDTSEARMNMTLVALCISGKVQMNINGMSMQFQKNELLMCPPNVTLSDIVMSPDFEFGAMFLTPSVLQSFLREKMSIWNDVMYVRKWYVMSLAEDDMIFQGHLHDMICHCFRKRGENPFGTEVAQSLLRACFLGLCGRLKMMVPQAGRSVRNNADGIFQQFLYLMSNNSKRYRTVESYAAELCISPKYLSAICKRRTGKTANVWITESVLEDIRYYLKQTNYSVKEISNIIGFPNPSFFGKYVKDHFGMTPMQLRG